MCEGLYLTSSEAGFQVYFQRTIEPLPCGDTRDLLSLALDQGPIGFLVDSNPDDTELADAHKSQWKPPVWWNDCSGRLKDSCHCQASLPEGKTPATFAHWLQARLFLVLCVTAVYRSFGLDYRRSLIMEPWSA